MEDKILIWRFNRGDCEAVKRIYEKYKHELVALAVALLKDLSSAEDVVHDVFVTFLQSGHFNLTGSLKGYLATCVANAARNVLRTAARRQQGSFEAAESVATNSVSPDSKAIFDEQSRLLSNAIWQLPYEQRETVLLHIQSGLTFSQIAKSQNISINTVQGRYRYGLEKLRSSLNGEVHK